MDNLELIDTVQKYISEGHKNSYTSPFLEIVRSAISEKTATPKQQAQLVKLERELAELPLPSCPSFPGSSTI